MGDEIQSLVAIWRAGKAQVTVNSSTPPALSGGLGFTGGDPGKTAHRCFTWYEVLRPQPPVWRLGCKLSPGTWQKGPLQTVTDLGLQQTAPKCSRWLQEPSLVPVGRGRGSNVNAHHSNLALQLQPGALPPARPGQCGAGVPPALEPLVWHVILNLVTCSVTRRQAHGWAFSNCWQEQTRSSEQMLPVRCQRPNVCPSQGTSRLPQG